MSAEATCRWGSEARSMTQKPVTVNAVTLGLGVGSLEDGRPSPRDTLGAGKRRQVGPRGWAAAQRVFGRSRFDQPGVKLMRIRSIRVGKLPALLVAFALLVGAANGRFGGECMITIQSEMQVSFASSATGQVASGERHRQSCDEATCRWGSEARSMTQKPVTVNAVTLGLGGSSNTVGHGA